MSTEGLLSPNAFTFSVNRSKEITYSCRDVLLPGLSIGQTEVPNPTEKMWFLPGDTVMFDDLILSFLVDEDMLNWYVLFDWIKQCAVTDTQLVSDGTLDILTNNNNANLKVVFQDLYPTSLTQIDFSTMATEQEPVVATATFKYLQYDIMSDKIAQFNPEESFDINLEGQG